MIKIRKGNTKLIEKIPRDRINPLKRIGKQR